MFRWEPEYAGYSRARRKSNANLRRALGPTAPFPWGWRILWARGTRRSATPYLCKPKDGAPQNAACPSRRGLGRSNRANVIPRPGQVVGATRPKARGGCYDQEILSPNQGDHAGLVDGNVIPPPKSALTLAAVTALRSRCPSRPLPWGLLSIGGAPIRAQGCQPRDHHK